MSFRFVPTVKPCDFCACLVMRCEPVDDVPSRPWNVWCTRCMAQGPDGKSEAEAMERWNRRAIDEDALRREGAVKALQLLSWALRDDPPPTHATLLAFLRLTEALVKSGEVTPWK